MGAFVAAALRVMVAVLVAVLDDVDVNVGRICSTRRVRGLPAGISMDSQLSVSGGGAPLAKRRLPITARQSRLIAHI